MADELEFVCEKCAHYEVCDRSSRMIWARLSKEKICTDFMEVVRCKDCKCWCYEYDDVGLCVTDVPDIDGVQRLADDFCSYGEKREV